MADQPEPFDFFNWLGGSIQGAMDGIGEMIGLPKKMFGVPSRDPVGETSQRMGNTGANRDSILSFLEDQNWMKSETKAGYRNAIGSADDSMLPFFQDEINRLSSQNDLNKRLGGVSDLMKGQITASQAPGITDEQKDKLQESTKSVFGANLNDAIKAIGEAFDPAMANKILAGQEMDARMKAGGELSTQLASQDIDISKFNATTQTERGKTQAYLSQLLGMNESSIHQPVSNMGGLFGTAAGLTDTDIQNQRFEEILKRGDLNSAIQFMSSQAQTGIEDILALMQMGNNGGGGGGGGSSGEAYGAAGIGLAGDLGAALITASDRNIKTDIKPISTGHILKKIQGLDIFKWKYRGESVNHIGPMAQDINKLFNVGTDKGIYVVDAIGILLSSIKELANKVEQLERKLK